MPAVMPQHDVNGGRLEPFHKAGWRGRVDHRWRHLADADPLEWLAGQPSETVRHRPSAITYRVSTDRGTLYVKHMTALKDREPQTADWLSGLRWWLQPSLALRVEDGA